MIPFSFGFGVLSSYLWVSSIFMVDPTTNAFLATASFVGFLLAGSYTYDIINRFHDHKVLDLDPILFENTNTKLSAIFNNCLKNMEDFNGNEEKIFP